MPQFVMTGIASIIFAIFDGAVPKSPDATTPSNSTTTSGELAKIAKYQLRDSLATPAAPNSYAIVFRCVFRYGTRWFCASDLIGSNRLGGVAATIAFVLTVRLARELRRRR